MARPKLKQHIQIKRGERTYEITEIERAPDGRSIYLAKRNDSRKPFGNIYHSRRDLEHHYPSIRSELRRRLK
jgi:hypothetical protein